MAKKIPCPQHYRYVANCPDCQRLNEEKSKPEPEAPHRLYQDVHQNDSDHTPVVRKASQRDDRGVTRVELPKIDEEPDENKKSPQRFHYQRPPNRKTKRVKIIIGIIVGVIVLIVGIYSLPLWLAGISLQEQLYALKGAITTTGVSVPLDYWKTFTLDLWSSNFFFNKTALIGAFIGSIIFSIPPETTILALIGTRIGRGRPSRKKALLFWWTIGFGLFYLCGQALDLNTYFSLTMFMIEEGKFTAPANPFQALYVLTNPNLVSMTDMFFYSTVVYPILIFIIVMIFIRLGISIIENSYLVKNSLKIIGDIITFIGFIFGAAYFNMALSPVDGLIIIRSYGVLFGFIGLVVLGCAISYIGSVRARQKQYVVLRSTQKRVLVSVIAVIIIILLPVFYSIPLAIGIGNNYNQWYDQEWSVEISREISWTRACAGITSWTSQPIENYINNVTTSDSQMIGSIRQYDEEVADLKMEAHLGTSFETLASTDIVYINGSEYWIAPTTINTNNAAITSTPVLLHTQVYDHSEGYLAMSTNTGNLLNATQCYQTFGVNASYPIFFGQSQSQAVGQRTLADEQQQLSNQFTSTPAVNAFEPNILLGSGWGEENDTYLFNYQGIPDGNLTGIEAFWYTLNMGLYSAAFNSTEKSFLINRNIIDRVGGILLSGLTIDPDPYLVFDNVDHKEYYALSVITQLPIGSFAQSPIYRFLGLVLVDVETGNLIWYLNPSLTSSIAGDPTANIWNIYLNYYPWQTTLPGWLIPQIRYPESLWQQQLQSDYLYHVTDPNTWYAANNFYEPPSNEDPTNDIFYIETDLGSGLEYVGMNAVEYQGTGAYTLAALYVVRQGANLGQCEYFQTSKTGAQLLGPATAEDNFNSTATETITLIGGNRFGNILLYPLAGSLYYYIPTYSTSGDLENLVLCGLVDAITRSMAMGDNATAAYDNLGLSGTTNQTSSSFYLSATGPSSITYASDNWAQFETQFQVLDTKASDGPFNLTLNCSIYSSGASVNVFNANLTGSPFTSGSGLTGYNYTIYSSTYYPGEGQTIMVQINQDPQSSPFVSMWVQFELIYNGTIVASTPSTILTINNNQSP